MPVPRQREITSVHKFVAEAHRRSAVGISRIVMWPVFLAEAMNRDEAYEEFQAGRSRLPNKTSAAHAPR